MKSVVLACAFFPERHFGEHIAEWIEAVLENVGIYDIPRDINVMTIDGASNGKLAVRDHVSFFEPPRLEGRHLPGRSLVPFS